MAPDLSRIRWIKINQIESNIDRPGRHQINGRRPGYLWFNPVCLHWSGIGVVDLHKIFMLIKTER